MSASTTSLASLAQQVGVAVGAVNELEGKANALRDAANINIAKLFEAKAKVGIYRKDGTGCALATAFIDGCMSANIKESTAQKTYLPTFKQAVATGKPVTDWNSQRAKGKAKGGSAKAAKGKKEFADKLATVYRDADFEGFINDLEESYKNDDIVSLLEGIKSYLEAEGIKLK